MWRQDFLPRREVLLGQRETIWWTAILPRASEWFLIESPCAKKPPRWLTASRCDPAREQGAGVSRGGHGGRGPHAGPGGRRAGRGSAVLRGGYAGDAVVGDWGEWVWEFRSRPIDKRRNLTTWDSFLLVIVSKSLDASHSLAALLTAFCE